MSVVFHSVEPESNKATFSQMDTVDFVIAGDRNVIRNSIRLEGKLAINQTASTRAVLADQLSLDKRVGANGLIDSMSCSIDGSVIENIGSEYARYVGMVQSATKSRDDYYSAKELCELKSPDDRTAILYSCGASNGSSTEGLSDLDFSFKPVMCLNRSSSDIPMSKGVIKISLNLARNVNALSGNNQIAGSNFVISEFRLTYRSSPPNPVDQIVMKSISMIKKEVNSGFANISTRVPAIVDAVSCSFLRTDHENTIINNTLNLETLPDLQEVQFLFNNATNQYQQYLQKDTHEFLHGYLESLKSSGHSDVSTENVKGQNGNGLGMSFGERIDLSNNKISVQIRSGVTSGARYLMYMYFHSTISV
tara:strand:+ start:861 stop:1952 length:1092 start_codon:yes stop_codon:yes gene_type:complete